MKSCSGFAPTKSVAVVAAEVRKLAERSKVAAEEINTLSKSSVGVTEEAFPILSVQMCLIFPRAGCK